MLRDSQGAPVRKGFSEEATETWRLSLDELADEWSSSEPEQQEKHLQRPEAVQGLEEGVCAWKQ